MGAGGRSIAAAGFLWLLVMVTGCGSGSAAPVAEGSPSASATTPGILGVRCTDGGTLLTGTAVATSVDGIRLRVTDQTARGDASLYYLVDGEVIGGDSIAGPDADLVFAPAPGEIQVACRHSSTDTSDAPVDLEVVDQGGDYRTPTTLLELGCQPGAGAYYPTTHDGATAEEAVQAAIDWEAVGYDYRVRRMTGGYWRVPGYGFVLDRDGHAWAAGAVRREGDHWQASLTVDCQPPTGSDEQSSDNAGSVLPTSSWRPGDAGQDALLTGRLMATADGCLFVSSAGGDTRTAVVWPRGYSQGRTPAGSWAVLDSAGAVVVHEGDQISVGGGFADVDGTSCMLGQAAAFFIQSSVPAPRPTATP